MSQFTVLTFPCAVMGSPGRVSSFCVDTEQEAWVFILCFLEINARLWQVCQASDCPLEPVWACASKTVRRPVWRGATVQIPKSLDWHMQAVTGVIPNGALNPAVTFFVWTSVDNLHLWIRAMHKGLLSGSCPGLRERRNMSLVSNFLLFGLVSGLLCSFWDVAGLKVLLKTCSPGQWAYIKRSSPESFRSNRKTVCCMTLCWF